MVTLTLSKVFSIPFLIDAYKAVKSFAGIETGC